MSALRKAGVWLGLVEEDDDRAYDDRRYRDNGYRDRDRDGGYRYADEFADEDDDVDDAPALPRARAADRSRLSERSARPGLEREDADRSDRGSVRSITRPAATSGDTGGAGSYPTRDNLALAPQPQAHQRAADDEQADEPAHRRVDVGQRLADPDDGDQAAVLEHRHAQDPDPLVADVQRVERRSFLQRLGQRGLEHR